MGRPKGIKCTEATKRSLSKILKTRFATEPHWLYDRTGPDGNNWQGGITPTAQQFRNSREGRRWRKEVLERDNYTCRMCGAPDCKLAHHIGAIEDYPKVAYEISNGLTVCSSCHRLIHIYAEAGAFDLLVIPESPHETWQF